jgi:NAD(P)H-binding
MKVFVAGATGVIGRALVPQLVARGHEVVGMTRSASKQELVRGLGARPVVADALEPDAVARAVASAEPEVIVHQLTALSGPMSMRGARHPDRSFAGRGCAPPDRRRPCTSNRTRSRPSRRPPPRAGGSDFSDSQRAADALAEQRDPLHRRRVVSAPRRLRIIAQR